MTLRKAISLCFAISILLCNCEKADITGETDSEPDKDSTIVKNDTIPHPEGLRDGSEEYPFMAGDLATGSVGQYILANDAEQGDCRVVGYIVGYVEGTSIGMAVFGSGDIESNIIIADNPYEDDPFNTVPVQLSTGSTYAKVRNDLNLYQHPENLGRKVVVTGKITTYMKWAGMKNTKDYRFL